MIYKQRSLAAGKPRNGCGRCPRLTLDKRKIALAGFQLNLVAASVISSIPPQFGCRQR